MNKKIMDEIFTLEEELYPHYREALIGLDIADMDDCVEEYFETVKKESGQLTNEQIRYYMGMFSYYAYRLNAVLSKQGLKSDIANMYHELKSARIYMDIPDNDGKKHTREEKSAISKLQTTDEVVIAMIFTKVTDAIERRIKAFSTLLNTLGTLSAMNMSEAKLGGKI